MKKGWNSSGQPRNVVAMRREKVNRENVLVEGNAIETRGLRRVFKSRNRVVEAVAGVDMTVRNGEIFGFLGPNGAGKTTTLRMLATLLPPSGGTATVAGCDLRTQSDQIRERIGYVG